GVIGGQDHRSGQRDALRVVVVPSEIGGKDQAEKGPSHPIEEAHRLGGGRCRLGPDAHLCGRSARRRWIESRMILLVCSAVSFELLITIAPRGTMSGAA